MRPLLGELWKDERGSLLVTEWVFVATILVLGILPTLVSVRDRVQQAALQVSPAIGITATPSDDTEPAN